MGSLTMNSTRINKKARWIRVKRVEVLKEVKKVTSLLIVT